LCEDRGFFPCVEAVQVGRLIVRYRPLDETICRAGTVSGLGARLGCE